MRSPAVALLYQALPPPIIDGLRKDAKPGGYSDGGADIGFALSNAGQHMVTPYAMPNPSIPLQWVFPDTAEGIAAALDGGADTLWANTILFVGHPIEAVLGQVAIVGQTPAATQAWDDKFATNRMMERAGLPVARGLLVAEVPSEGICALGDIDRVLDEQAIGFPLILKPVRGRGSQGVTLIHDSTMLQASARALLDQAKFGNLLMIEEYLDGEEMTVTVMPPASPRPSGDRDTDHWALRPVLRFNQRDGVAPYNGDVAVTENSAAIPQSRLDDPAIQAMLTACTQAATLVESRAAIRIDCRADADGNFKLFDLNMKPNMTGPGRPGRDNQDCLSAIAARAEGWSYAELLQSMLAGAWVHGDDALSPS